VPTLCINAIVSRCSVFLCDQSKLSYFLYLHIRYKEHRVESKEDPQVPAKKLENCSVNIVELWQMPKSLLAIVKDERPDTLYTHEQALEALWDYIKEKELSVEEASTTSSVPRKKESLVKLDSVLLVLLTSSGQEVLKKQDLVQLFKSKLKPFYRISYSGEEYIRKGPVKNIQIQTEQRQGRKFVSKVSNLEGFGISPSDCADELRSLLAASASTQQLPGKNAGEMLIVQGRMTKELVEHFTKKYGIPKKYIESLDKGK